MKSFKDLIYFDVERARSLISLLDGGLINEISKAFEDASGSNGFFTVDVKIVKAKFGNTDKEKTITTQKIEVFHEMINEIEKKLDEHSLLNNLNSEFEKGGISFNQLMDKIPSMNYIKSTGWATFEDVERFKNIMGNFNDINRFIHRSPLVNSEEVKAVRKTISEAKEKLKSTTDSKARNLLNSQIKTLEKKLNDILDSSTKDDAIDKEFVDGTQKFLDTFSPERLNFRLIPFDNHIQFQVLANLKSKYIIDGDFNSIIYTYGTRPNIKLTCFGIITSAPRENDIRINPNNELDEIDYKHGTERFDLAFRNVFAAFEQFEKFFFTPQFPKVAISPIAIYREVHLKS